MFTVIGGYRIHGILEYDFIGENKNSLIISFPVFPSGFRVAVTPRGPCHAVMTYVTLVENHWYTVRSTRRIELNE